MARLVTEHVFYYGIVPSYLLHYVTFTFKVHNEKRQLFYLSLYRVIQEEGSIFLKVVISVFMKE
jgi:hypothetical protein